MKLQYQNYKSQINLNNQILNRYVFLFIGYFNLVII